MNCALQARAIDIITRTGWSVIPLIGGQSDNAKQPAGRWSTYSQRHATRQEIRRWRGEALGIVCGQVSGIVVMEFDDADTYTEFSQRFPELIKTYTVRSGKRQLPHLYWHVDYTVRNRDYRFGSLRSDGKYVVADGCDIQGHRYTLIEDSPARHISEDELGEALLFLDKLDGRQTTIIETTTSDKTANIQTWYMKQAVINGRNNALYRTACKAKAQGINEQTTINTLLQLHVEMPPNGEHPKESEKARAAEAYNTIRSAYQQTATRLERGPQPRQKPGLPTAVRETLLKQQGSTITARVLDLMIQNFKPGDTISKEDITTLARQHNIARQSVLKALSGKIAGQQIIPIVTPNVGYGDKRRHFYKIPTILSICKLLQVNDLRSDPLPNSALRSAHAYRLAIHKALLNRSPGMYPIDWLAKRLSVSRRTLFRYNAKLKVITTPIITYETLNFANLDRFQTTERRKDGVTPGFWVQNDVGERWPAVRGLAAKLLSQGQNLIVCHRLPNMIRLPGTPGPDIIWINGRQLQLQENKPPPVVPEMVTIPGTHTLVQLPRFGPDGASLHWKPFVLDPDDYPKYTPVFHTSNPLSHASINRILPPDDIVDEMDRWWEESFILVKNYKDTGFEKRFPPRRAIAGKLLRTHEEVHYVVRDDGEWKRIAYREALYCLKDGDLKQAIHFFRQARLLDRSPIA